MAQLPFPITATDLEDMKFQLWEILRQLYEEKIGGAELADVSSIPGDVLTLVLADPSGLTKTGNELAVDAYSAGGLQINSNGLSAKLISTGGLEASASGLGIKLDGASLSVGTAGLKIASPPSFSSITVETINATNDLTVSCGVDKTITLTETVWDDFPPAPIISARLGATALFHLLGVSFRLRQKLSPLPPSLPGRE